MKKNVKKWLAWNVIVIALFLALFFAYEYASSIGKFSCAFKDTFHLYCPGCGGTRAVDALLHFDILASLRFHPAVLLGALLFFYYDIRFLIAYQRNDLAYFEKERFFLVIAYAVFLIGWFLLRNYLLVKYRMDFIGDLL